MTNELTTLPLPRLDIEHYKAFEKLELENLGQINLIVGANNCGKTTVLDYVFDTYHRVGNHFPIKFVHTHKVLGLPFLVPRSPQESAEIARLLAIADPGITRVEEKSTLYVYHQRIGSVDFPRLGSGVQRLIQIALAISHSENGVVLIDDAETGLHPAIMYEAFAWIVQWAKKHNVQMFLTTHSLDLVDTLVDATGGWGDPANGEGDEDDEDDIPEGDLDLVLFRLEPRDEETRVVRHGRDRLRRLRGDLGVDVLL